MHHVILIAMYVMSLSVFLLSGDPTQGVQDTATTTKMDGTYDRMRDE